MRDPNLIPWDVPEYLAMVRGEIPYDKDEEDYDYDYDASDDDGDNYCCRRCDGGGCRTCLDW